MPRTRLMYDGVPVWAIAPIRTALQAARVDPASIDDAGEIVASKLLGSFYTSAEVRTRITPSVSLDLAEQMSGPPSPLVQWLQPTVILRGPAGERVIAPYGVAEESSGAALLIPVLALFGLGFIAGRL